MPSHEKDVKYESLMKRKQTAEAGDWLANQAVPRNIGILTSEESIGYVKRLYGVGAVTVFAVDIRTSRPRPRLGQTEACESASVIIVELPTKAELRRELFKLGSERAHLEGFDGVPDEGQRYLFFKMD